MEEVWVQSPTYEKYEVSNMGNVRHKDHRDRIRRLQINKRNGYAYLPMNYNGKFKNVRVHRMVAEAFLPKPDGKDFVNHKDGNKANNCVSNLEWCTASENERHSVDVLGKHTTPPIHFKPVLDTTTGIRYPSIKAAAEALEVDYRKIGDVVHGRRKCVKGHKFELVTEN